MVSFSQLPAVKRDTIFGASQTKLGPSYFIRALESDLNELGSKLEKVKPNSMLLEINGSLHQTFTF